MADVILTPKTVDEIEFFVSADGEKTGVSIRGLARLAGVDHKSISNLLQSLSNFLGEGKATSDFQEWLASLNLPSDLQVFAGEGVKERRSFVVVFATRTPLLKIFYKLKAMLQ